MIRRPARAFAFVVQVGLALGVAAGCLASELVYKSFGPRGEVSYGFAPAPGAVRTEPIEITTLPPAQRHALMRLPEAGAGSRSRWNRVELEIKAAHSELRRAENALDAGRNTRAGEMIGNKGGGVRLTQAYFDRIGKLETKVETAKRRLDQAYEARNQEK